MKELNDIFLEEIAEIEADIELAEQNLHDEIVLHGFKMKLLLDFPEKAEVQSRKHDKDMEELGATLAMCKGHLEEVYGSRERRLGRFSARQGL